MKKIILSSLVLVGSLFANDFNKTFTQTLTSNLKKEGNVKIISVDELKSLNGLKFVVADVNGDSTPFFVSSDGKNALGFPSFTLVSDDKDRQIIEDRMTELKAELRAEQEKIAYELIKTIPEDRFIHINSFDKNNKFVTYMVTDPECPHCVKEISKMVKWLRNANVKLIFAPVHGKSAYTKSAIMLKEAKKIGPDNQEAIMKLLEKYYTPDTQVSDDEATEEERLMVLEDAKKLFSKGVIKSVPFSFTVEKE
ncbi:MAG: hypothetical protein GX282_05595 [Campylobacteraceae bacterium]|nr:hypothetical protein [Campylobacteraceae bacterium]